MKQLLAAILFYIICSSIPLYTTPEIHLPPHKDKVSIADCYNTAPNGEPHFNIDNDNCIEQYVDLYTGVIQEIDPSIRVCSGPLVLAVHEDNLGRTPTDHEAWNYTTIKYGCDDVECGFLSIDNVNYYAEQFLWPMLFDERGYIVRVPCGGAANCYNTFSDRTYCVVSVNDCSMTSDNLNGTTLSVHVLDCSSTESCKTEHISPTECCAEIHEN